MQLYSNPFLLLDYHHLAATKNSIYSILRFNEIKLNDKIQ